MRKRLSAILRFPCAATVIIAAGTSVLLAGVRGTPHDLSAAGWSRGEICLPCHVSHRGNQEQYSWNHAYPSDSAFTKRDGATLGMESLTCLGCHDGQTALDSFGGAAGSTVMTGSAVVGRDLSDDHPVGVAYPTGRPRYRSPVTVEQDLRLYDGRIQCGSCHDVHNNARGNFLRVESRLLCQICHDY